jgi:hypothetical protein
MISRVAATPPANHFSFPVFCFPFLIFHLLHAQRVQRDAEKRMENSKQETGNGKLVIGSVADP